MFSRFRPNRLPDAGPSVPDQPWHRVSFSTTAEAPAIIGRVTAAMEEKDYSHKDVFGMHLALEEALVNAVKHGNRGDPAKRVWVRYKVWRDRTLVTVEDEGQGFDPDQLPDPLAPENLDRAGGRGLLLMRSYMTWVRYNKCGNAVSICKHRSG